MEVAEGRLGHSKPYVDAIDRRTVLQRRHAVAEHKIEILQIAGAIVVRNGSKQRTRNGGHRARLASEGL